MFHRTHAGAYVHFSRILPNDEKTSKKWPFFGQKLSFLASDKRLKTIFIPKSAKKGSFLVKNLIFFAFSQAVEDFPPILRVLDAKGCRHTQIRKTQFTASICTKISHFS